MRAPPLRDRLDKATLEKLYNEHGLSTVEIAQRFGSHSPNVIVLMEKYGIPRRSKGGGKKWNEAS
jgi:hypothetical protein